MYAHMGKGDGGAETVFKQVAEGLEKRGHMVYRVYNEEDGTEHTQSKETYLPLYVPPTWKGFLRPSFAYKFFASLLALYRVLRTVKPEVVNCHYLTPAAVHFTLLKWILGYRLVLSCHGSDVVSTQGLRPKMMPFLLERASAVTCVSQNLAERLQDQFPGSYSPRVVHNGIDLDFWMDRSIYSRKQTGQEERHRIISVGSLKRVKGHDILIEAFRDVVDTRPSATLQIVGDGPLRSEYEVLIDQKGLGERVELVGWCSPEEVRKRLRKASLFAFPSRHEGFGLALVEAMAVGLPIVASDTGGIPEVVGPDFEFLASTNAPDQYSRKICRLLDNDALREAVGNQCHERAKKFGWSNTIKRYESTLSTEEL